MINLFETNNEVCLLLPWSLMTFSWEGKLALWTHAWLDVDHLGSNSHFLSLSITLEHNSLKADLLFASKIEFFKSTFHCNCQV